MDGQASPPIPAWKPPELPPYLNELAALGNHSILEYARTFLHYTQRKDASMNQLADQAENAAREKEKAAVRMKEAALRFKEERGIDPPLKRSSRLTYWFFALIMLVVEVPLNVYIFRMIGDNELGNMMMAVAVGMIILYCAHYLGCSLREKETGSYSKALQIAALASPLLIIALSAAIRESYVSSDPEMANRISPLRAYGFFGAYNLGIFVAGLLLARSAHDPPLDHYHQRRKEHGRHLKRFTSLMEQLAHGIKERAEKRKAVAREAGQVRESIVRLGQIYQVENLRCRSDRGDFADQAMPCSFQTPLNMPMPKELENDWEPPKYVQLIQNRAEQIRASKQAVSGSAAGGLPGTEPGVEVPTSRSDSSERTEDDAK